MHISVCSKSAVTKRMRFTWMHEIWMKVSFIMKLLNEDIVLEFYVQSINIIAFWDHSLVHNTIIYQIFPVPRLQNMYQNNTEKIVLTYFVAKFYCFPIFSKSCWRMLETIRTKGNIDIKLFQLFDMNHFTQDKLFSHS